MYQYEDYSVLIEKLSTDDGDGYIVTIPELAGCVSEGETRDEALESIREAFDSWMEAAQASETSIPSPRKHVNDYSGKFQVRVPRSLHQSIARRADLENISQNAVVNSALSMYISHDPETLAMALSNFTKHHGGTNE